MIKAMLIQERETTAKDIKRELGISANVRTVQKYIKILGWKRIRTKFCQTVSTKNRVERVVFSTICSDNSDNFDTTIFIDESIVAMNKNGPNCWFKVFLHENNKGFYMKIIELISIR